MEFFFQTMQICGAGPYDQHLMLGEHELTDHSQSLAALGIFPGALLTLKVGNEAIIKVSSISRQIFLYSFLWNCYEINEELRSSNDTLANKRDLLSLESSHSSSGSIRTRPLQDRWKGWSGKKMIREEAERAESKRPSASCFPFVSNIFLQHSFLLSLSNLPNYLPPSLYISFPSYHSLESNYYCHR